MKQGKKGKRQRKHAVSRGIHGSSMKTSGFNGPFIPCMKHVKPKWSEKERASIFRFIFATVKAHEQGKTD